MRIAITVNLFTTFSRHVNATSSLYVLTSLTSACLRQIFYWTHLLSIPTWVLLILHSPNFWKWFLVPGALFALEVACRVSRVCSDRGRSTVTSATLLPSEVSSPRGQGQGTSDTLLQSEVSSPGGQGQVTDL